MKDYIITHLENLSIKLSKIISEKVYWENFLVTLAQNNMNNEIEIKNTLRPIISSNNFKKVFTALKTLNEEINGFPFVELIKLLIDLSDEKLKEKEVVLEEVKDVLSELAVPVLRLWKDIIVAPLVGTLDSERAQSMAEKLLAFTSETRAKYVIIDVTGVNVIDTIVGGFLIETFNAIKLLGTNVILTGIKPNIAHTLVKIGIDFNMVIVKRDLETALNYLILEK
ncbi:rsbT co-antagonist protein RsbR [Hypnocyclicus thermotrophus]|uniref:RsbT co-antagonist protein RsbR n=1 Tax=Hypnocyclicus thermotrophus TaxID=1627895 RepID=A0AA46E058_9FUSO|nr:STAS domain-containing protein [Hypnocyclicus thermotrophus]TDT72350.1 rsbT co-antagonist protein RsbR [Hypnocyclicus thermotrophus]